MTSVNEPLYRPDILIEPTEEAAKLSSRFYEEDPMGDLNDLRRFLIDTCGLGIPMPTMTNTLPAEFAPKQFLGYHTALEIWEGVQHQHLVQALSHPDLRPDDVLLVSKNYPAIAITRNYGNDRMSGVGPAFVGWIDMFTGELWWVMPMTEERKVLTNPLHDMLNHTISFESPYPKAEAGEDVADVVHRILDERFPQQQVSISERWIRQANSVIGKGFVDGIKQSIENLSYADGSVTTPVFDDLTEAQQRAQQLHRVEQTGYWSGETVSDVLGAFVARDELFKDAADELAQSYANGFRRAFTEKGYLNTQFFDQTEVIYALRRYFDWLGSDEDRVLGVKGGDYGIVDLESISLNDLARVTNEWMEVVSDRIHNEVSKGNPINSPIMERGDKQWLDARNKERFEKSKAQLAKKLRESDSFSYEFPDGWTRYFTYRSKEHLISMIESTAFRPYDLTRHSLGEVDLDYYVVENETEISGLNTGTFIPEIVVWNATLNMSMAGPRPSDEISWESETRCPHSVTHGEPCRYCPDRIAQPSGNLPEATENYIEDFSSLDAASTPEELAEVAEMETMAASSFTIVSADGTETVIPGLRELTIVRDTQTMGDSMFPDSMITAHGPYRAVAFDGQGFGALQFSDEESADFEKFLKHALQAVDHLPKPSEDNVFIGHHTITINGLADGPINALCDVYVTGDGELRLFLPERVYEIAPENDDDKVVDLDAVAVYGTLASGRSLEFVFTNDETIKLTGQETYLALLEYVNRREMAEDYPEEMAVGPAIIEALELFDTEWMIRAELGSTEDAAEILAAKEKLIELIESIPIFYDRLSLHQETTLDELANGPWPDFSGSISFADDDCDEAQAELDSADSETAKADPNPYAVKVLKRLIDWWETSGPMTTVEGISIDEAFIRYIEELQDQSGDLADFLIGCIPTDVLAESKETHPIKVARSVVKHYINEVESQKHKLALFEATETLAFSYLADFFQIANKTIQAQRYSDNIGSPEVRKVLESVLNLRQIIRDGTLAGPIEARWRDQQDRRVQETIDRTRRKGYPTAADRERDMMQSSESHKMETPAIMGGNVLGPEGRVTFAEVEARLKAERDAYAAMLSGEAANRPREN